MVLDLETISSIIAATLTTSSFLPQAIKTISTKDTSGISLTMYLLFFIGVIFWAIFGIAIKSYPIVIANIITLILSGAVLGIKLNNSFKPKK